MESVKITLASKIKTLYGNAVGELKENYMMRNLVIVAVLMLCFCSMAVAQELPKFEIFGGWSFVRPDGGGDGYQGWNASVTSNLNENIGIVMDGSGYYTSEEEYCGRAHSFMVGPKFSLREHEKVTPFWHAMFGVIHTGYDFYEGTEVGEGEEEVEVWISDATDNFAMAFGGGLDVKVNEMFSIRAFQADYLLERSFGDIVPNLRFSAGIVIAIGER
jgi:hypothetical protein